MTQRRVRLDDVAAMLLDMDGTLVESDAAVERAWVTWAAEHQVDPDAAVALAHGSPADRTVRQLLPELDDAAVAAAAQRQLALQYHDLSDVNIATGGRRLLDTIERLQMPWAVVTSADVPLATARLSAAGIDPPLLITVEDVSVGKPDPECYLLAAQRLGVDPRRCLVVEDSAPGLAAARAAGAMTAALRGFDGDVKLRTLDDLVELLQSWQS